MPLLQRALAHSWALAIVTFCLLPPPLQGQARSVGMRDYGNRREGTTVEHHSDFGLTLLGLHRSFSEIPRDVTLQIRFFLPTSIDPSVDNDGKLSLDAIERFDTKNYLMQAKAFQPAIGSWRYFGPWPTKDVIDPLAGCGKTLLKAFVNVSTHKGYY